MEREAEAAPPSDEWCTTTTILESLTEPGNDRAWGRLVARFRPLLLAFFERRGVRGEGAEDLAQETLLELARSYTGGRYERGRGRLGAWIFGIAEHRLQRHGQSLARRREVPLEDGSPAAETKADAATREVWEAEWERWALDECLKRARIEFEPITFRAFVLATLDGYTAADAAHELGVPIKTVYNAKHRVLKRVRQLRAELDTAA